ncbi:hypothetical protein PoB_003505400 [Plakobranchus ocellatus]|uniref:Uncharacterized protein n=1 Tax=Plakobranchus ocellatus TaxID=259542 RepID=A0AAV4AQW9_9GAST|nr:hypothetical protein PoB_003505400 [Plakobranchus ocellatus]
MPNRKQTDILSKPGCRRQSGTTSSVQPTVIQLKAAVTDGLPSIPVATFILNQARNWFSASPLPLQYCSPTKSVDTDMKITPKINTTTKKTVPIIQNTTTNINTLAITSSSGTCDTNINRLSLQEQEQRSAANMDANNNNKNTSSAIDKSDKDNCFNSNLNLNKNNMKRMSGNDNDHGVSDSDVFLLRRRLHRIDSGFCSSASDEDATNCHCGINTTASKSSWPRRGKRISPRKPSILRSQSWSSLDSDICSSTSSDHPNANSPSVSSFSSLSSLWSSASSSRTNLSCNVSQDSLVWGSSLCGGLPSDGSSTATETDREPSVPAVPTSVVITKTPESDSQSLADCDGAASRTDRNSNVLALNPPSLLPVCSAQNPEDENVQEGSAISTHRPNNSSSSTLAAVTDIRHEQAASYVRPVSARPACPISRRHRSRDHNNNTGLQRGMGPHEFLPRAPCRLGDWFNSKGVMAFIALIAYTLTLVVVFSVFRTVSKSFKAVMGIEDLKEMRRSLSHARRSRRAPLTSG